MIIQKLLLEKEVVAVVDTGVNINHPDLNKNIWVNQKELNGKPGVDDDQNGFCLNHIFPQHLQHNPLFQ